MLIPVALVIDVILVYPLLFLMTTISIFFRPARVAILPGIVRTRRAGHRQLRDVGGRDDRRRHRLPSRRTIRCRDRHRAAGGVLLDAVTYLASAALLSSIILRKPAELNDEATDDDEEQEAVETGAGEGFIAELKAGYRFLRTEATLFANTIQATVAQTSVGVLTSLMVGVCVRRVRRQRVQPERG